MPNTPVLTIKGKVHKHALKVTVGKSKIIAADMTDISEEPWSVQLTPCDMAMPRGYIQFCYFFKNVQKKSGYMTSRKLKRSLSYVLRYFPTLAGRLRYIKEGGMSVKVNNKGIEFIKAQGDFSMPDIETKKGTIDMTIVPPGITPAFVDIPYLLRIQATYLKDNSLILCVLINHSLCDGPGAFTFMRAWAEIASSRDDDLTALAVNHDRTQLYPDFKPSRYPHDEYKIYKPDELDRTDEEPPACACCAFQLTSDKVNMIRKSIDETDCAVSNQNIICALFWRFVTRARGIPEGTQTTLGLACNGRAKLNPPLPKGYFGNAVFYGMARLDAQQVISMPVAELAVYVHEAEDNLTDDYIRSAVNWIEDQPDKTLVGPSVDCCYGNDFAISSWSQLPVFDVDFGEGRPIAFKIPVQAVDGVMIVLPLREEGNVEIVLGLQKEHMDKLLEDEELQTLLLLQ